ncbi:MAG: flagellar FlbD family protein [Thermoguttaceae bacterium]
MIKLSRLNGSEFILNAELIKTIEVCPDTLITLISCETLMVCESLDEVVRRVITYHQAKNLTPKQKYAPCEL